MKEIIANNELANNITIVSHEPALGGEQYIFDCGNGYGASVIKSPYTYGGANGKWELAVLKFSKENYFIDYDNEVSEGDVLGHLDDSEVMDLLIRISQL